MSANQAAHGRLSTVWEVLSQNAREFVQIMQSAALAEHWTLQKPGPLNDSDALEIDILWRHLVIFCQDANLTTTSRVLASTPMQLTGASVSGALKIVLATFHAELDARRVYFLTSPWAYLYEKYENPFGVEVDGAFPSIRRELKEAARCMALERYTAAVMHLMRSTETPLKLLCDAVGLAFSHASGEKLLNDIRVAIKAVASGAAKPPAWKEDEKFYSDAEAHLRAFKDAWRNYAMHLHDTYDEREATEIWHSTKAFMTGIAGRLHE